MCKGLPYVCIKCGLLVANVIRRIQKTFTTWSVQLRTWLPGGFTSRRKIINLQDQISSAELACRCLISRVVHQHGRKPFSWSVSLRFVQAQHYSLVLGSSDGHPLVVTVRPDWLNSVGLFCELWCLSLIRAAKVFIFAESSGVLDSISEEVYWQKPRPVKNRHKSITCLKK